MISGNIKSNAYTILIAIPKNNKKFLNSNIIYM